MWARLPGRAPLYPKTQFACTVYPITLRVATILLRLYVELIALCAILFPSTDTLRQALAESDDTLGLPRMSTLGARPPACKVAALRR